MAISCKGQGEIPVGRGGYVRDTGGGTRAGGTPVDEPEATYRWGGVGT